jgi:hypothetical protein
MHRSHDASPDTTLTLPLPHVGKAELVETTVYPITAESPPATAIPGLGMSLKRSAHLAPTLDRFGDRPLERGNVRLVVDPVEGKAQVLEGLHDEALAAGLKVIPNSAAHGERHGAHISIAPARLRSFAEQLRQTGDPALAQVADSLAAYDPEKAPLQLSLRDYRRVATGTTTPTEIPADDNRRHSDVLHFAVDEAGQA